MVTPLFYGQIIKVHLYYSEGERESDVAPNGFINNPTECLHCAGIKIKERNRFRVRWNIKEPLAVMFH